MKKFNKIISMLLAVLMMVSSFTVMFTVEVFADDAADTETTTGEGNEENQDAPTVEVEEEIDYTKQIYATPEEKLATMRLALEKDGYQLYVDDYSGEIACVNTKTGEKIFTNPYDVGASMGNDTTKYEILSQIIVKFTDHQGQDKTFTSFEQAALRGQIATEPIKNGIRVEYTIGREQTKTLVPRLISKERFDEIILAAALEAFGDDLYSDDPSQEVFKFQKFLTYYVLYAKEDAYETKEERNKMENLLGGISDNLMQSDRQLTAVLRDYPIVDQMDVYVFDPKASEAEVAMCEELILTYCPEYTYEELEYDHAVTEYESEDENPPVFRMALEYKLDGEGLSVRLPANGIRFNESLYTLDSIEVLPYMGAGNSGYDGYNFFPDGSGTLFDFEDLNTTQTRSVIGKVYGTDFAYHEITGTYQKTIRYPVFGIVEDYYYYTYTESDIDTDEIISQNTLSGAIVEAVKANLAGEPVRSYKGKDGTLASQYGKTITNTNAVEDKVADKRGFVAIIEEGDALASLATYHAGSLSDYNTIKMSFTPRPKDTYNLQDSISVGSNSEWTVVSDRKYVGGYKMKYIMLSDVEANKDEDAANDIERYDASWFGMAVAYRDYLTKQGILTKLTADEIKKDIPLYVETFGAVETTKKYLSIPVTVMESLTTFEEIIEMYEFLSGAGIKNVNFKLTGYANGGMYYSVPGKLKFEKVVGGNDGFQELLDKAAEINASGEDANIGIFPDFDLVYELSDELFDGYSTKEHAAKTIDDRYATRREYSATQQKYMNYYELIISPAYFYVLYERITKNYANKYDNVMGISVSTLGDGLHSDFDEDEPYNREDSKDFTVKAFDYLDKTYGEVMTEGGNAYVWKYVDHLLDVSLDSSRYNFSANAVPFIGVVLHGSVNFTGEPLNMEGDMQYAVLKAIENGASPYFILSYKNTQILKEYFDLSQYYSIMYEIWQDDIVEVYETLNTALADVQNKYIVDHKFLTGERVPDSDELEADIFNEYVKDLEDEQNMADIIAKEIALKASEAREAGRVAEAYAADALLQALSNYNYQINLINNVVVFDEEYYDRAYEAYLEYEKVSAYSAYKSSENADEQKLYQEYVRADKILDVVTSFNVDYDEAARRYDEAYAAIAGITNLSELKAASDAVKKAYKAYVDAKKDETRAEALVAIETALAENAAKADEYFKYEATIDAIEIYFESGFGLDYDECFEVCFNNLKTSAYFSASSFKKAALDNKEIITDWYASYVDAKNAFVALEAEVETFEISTGKIDSYVEAIAKRDAYAELGYETTEDEAKAKLYNTAKAQVSSNRTQAIQATARVQGANLKALQELLETVGEHLEIANAAIDVLVDAEGREDTSIVLQAKNRAEAVADYLNNPRFVEIVDGRAYLDENGDPVMLNGNALRYTRDKDGKVYYYYGTLEAGYSYFTKVKNAETGEEEFAVYHIGTIGGHKDGGNTYDGLNVYEVSEKGQKYYYTATVEGGYTYLTFNTDYNRYESRVPTTYVGEQIEGTEVFYDADADVYYSVNADGTYTRYNYYKSIIDYVNEAVELSVGENGEKNTALAIIEKFDKDFAEAVQKRIDRDNVVVEDENDEEETDVVSRYTTENIVSVTYGNDDGTPYKTMILNYNNYTVKIVIDFTDDGIDNGMEYTIPAYEFVIIER